MRRKIGRKEEDAEVKETEAAKKKEKEEGSKERNRKEEGDL